MNALAPSIRRACAAVFLAALCCSASAALPAGITQGPSVEGITEYDLSNGLRVLLFPDASQAKTTVNITYLVGSRMENYGETGMAHLLEHMLFKGTPSRGNIMTALGQRGMDFNGSTWFDRTNYFETFSASDENLDYALGMEADRMVNSFVARKDLDSEMTVVRNEMERNENNAVRILIQRTTSAAYNWHSYGKDTIGARSDVELVDIGRLQAFYHLYYQPDNAVLVIAGAFDPDKALAMVAKYFGPIPKPTRVLPRALHRGAGAGRRAASDAAPGRQYAVARRPLSHGARRASRRGRDRSGGRRDDRRARRPLVQGAGRNEEGGQRRRLRLQRPRSGLCDVPGEGARRGSDRQRARGHAADGRRRQGAASHRGRARPRAREDAAIDRGDHQQSAAPGRVAVAVDRGGRLAAVLSAPRPVAQGDARGRRPGRGDVLQAGQPHHR